MPSKLKLDEFKKIMTEQQLNEVRFLSNLDSNQQLYFARELEYVRSTIYQTKYPTLKARSLFTPDFQVNAGAKTVTYKMMSQYGESKIIANYAKDLPEVGLNATEVTKNVRELGNSFSWTWKDVRSAAMTGLSLDSSLAAASRRSAYELENRIAFFGDTSHNIPGFFTNPNIPLAPVENDGFGASTLWTTKNVDQWIRDIGDMIDGVSNNTNEVEQADTVLLPLTARNQLNRARVPDTNMTAMKYLQENYPYITKWEWLTDLETAGTGSTRLAAAYDRSADKVFLDVPHEYEMQPVQMDGLTYKVPVVMSTAGVSVIYPLACNFVYGF
jgi:hypothetical protein